MRPNTSNIIYVPKPQNHRPSWKIKNLKGSLCPRGGAPVLIVKIEVIGTPLGAGDPIGSGRNAEKHVQNPYFRRFWLLWTPFAERLQNICKFDELRLPWSLTGSAVSGAETRGIARTPNYSQLLPTTPNYFQLVTTCAN